MPLYCLLIADLLRKKKKKKKKRGGGGASQALHETLLKTPKSAGLANTLPNACKERSNPTESKKEGIINNSESFAAAALAPSLFFVTGGDFV